MRGRVFSWLTPRTDDGEELDPIENAPGAEQDTPDHRLRMDGARDEIAEAVGNLPGRQPQAFLLRVWEGLDVKETAAAMGCSEGSVKTHYSRAVHALRDVLQEYQHD